MSAKLVLKSLQLVKRKKNDETTLNSKTKKKQKSKSGKIEKKVKPKGSHVDIFKRNMEKLEKSKGEKEVNEDIKTVLDYINNRGRRFSQSFEPETNIMQSSDFAENDTNFENHSEIFGGEDDEEVEEENKKTKKRKIFQRKK